ncbi:MAG: hypothetical protein GXY76_03090 [Chloroflexi bacterium]|nr:hypothetical protein [Chloroflexota bacterium]
MLATGITPGFVMDSLPLNLTGLCQRVDHIGILRLQNASNRRGPFQKKNGSGLTVAEFQEQMAGGRMGHVGLIESIGMMMDTLGKSWPATSPAWSRWWRSGLCARPISRRSRGVASAQSGWPAPTRRRASSRRLTFHAYLDALDEKDVITIAVVPALEVTLRGTNGDLTTVAIVVNAIRRVREAAPGLVTMRDLPIVTNW